MAFSSPSVSRREALASLSALGAFNTLTRMDAKEAGYAPILASQIYIWVQHFDAQHKTIVEGLDEAFAGIKSAGFHRLELMSELFTPETRERTASLLAKHGLKLDICYAGKNFHEEEPAKQGLAEVLDLARTVKPIGVRAINFNPLPKPGKAVKTPEELAIQSRHLNELGRSLHETGMALFIHQHDPEMKENAREWRHDLTNTDPKYVSFCLDTDWVVRGGLSPMDLLREAGPRVASLHLRSGRKGVWMEQLGNGEPDYRQIAAYLKSIQYRGYLIVELAYEKATQVTRTLTEDLDESRRYAEETFGVKA